MSLSEFKKSEFDNIYIFDSSRVYENNIYTPSDVNLFYMPENVNRFKWIEYLAYVCKESFSLPPFSLILLTKIFHRTPDFCLKSIVETTKIIFEERMDDSRGNLSFTETAIFQTLLFYFNYWREIGHPFNSIHENKENNFSGICVFQTDILTEEARNFFTGVLAYHLLQKEKGKRNKTVFLFKNEYNPKNKRLDSFQLFLDACTIEKKQVLY